MDSKVRWVDKERNRKTRRESDKCTDTHKQTKTLSDR